LKTLPDAFARTFSKSAEIQNTICRKIFKFPNFFEEIFKKFKKFSFHFRNLNLIHLETNSKLCTYPYFQSFAKDWDKLIEARNWAEWGMEREWKGGDNII